MIPGNDPARLVARLRSLLQKGKTIIAAAAATGQSKSNVHRIAKKHGLPRRRRSLPTKKKWKLEQHLQAAKLTLSEIARKLQVAKSTVSRHSSMRLERECGPEQTRRVKTAQRCPNGHKINRLPCLTCLARANSAKPRAD